jgi:hypothetical protein
MPASFLWPVGAEMRPFRVTFRPPPYLGGMAGTLLLPTSDSFTFTAPNLQYFLD